MHEKYLQFASYFRIISCKEVLEGQMIKKKKIRPTAIISRVLSQTLRISAFLSCIRSMRYAGASGKKLLRIRAFGLDFFFLFLHSPGFFQLQISLRTIVTNFPSHHMGQQSSPSHFLGFFKSHFKVPEYSSKLLKLHAPSKKIHFDLLLEIHVPNVLFHKVHILWNGLIFYLLPL